MRALEGTSALLIAASLRAAATARTNAGVSTDDATALLSIELRWEEQSASLAEVPQRAEAETKGT